MQNKDDSILERIVRTQLDEREGAERWILTGIIFVIIIYAFLAVRIALVVNDVEMVNNLKREMIVKELQTDSLKRAKTDSLVKKYDQTVKEWNSLKK